MVLEKPSSYFKKCENSYSHTYMRKFFFIDMTLRRRTDMCVVHRNSISTTCDDSIFSNIVGRKQKEVCQKTS